MRVLQNFKQSKSANVSQNSEHIKVGSVDSKNTVPNVSQYGGNIDLNELESAKKWANAAKEFAENSEESAKRSEESALSAENSASEALDSAGRAEVAADRAEEISTSFEGVAEEVIESAKNAQESAVIAADHALDAEYSASKAKDSEELSSFFAISSATSAVAAKESEINAKESEKASKEIYEAFMKGVVYRGGWKVQEMQAYPPHSDTNSVWDIVLDEGVVKYEWNGITWYAGDRLIYSVVDDQYFHINHVSGVESVNGKTGAVILSLQDIEDSWKWFSKAIGNISTETDLHQLWDLGYYKSESSDNKWINLPTGSSNSFVLEVKSNSGSYRSFKLTDISGKTWCKSQTSYDIGSLVWTKWIQSYDETNKPTVGEIGAVDKLGDTMTGPLVIKADLHNPLTLTSTISTGLELNVADIKRYLGVSTNGHLMYGDSLDHDSNGRIYTTNFIPSWDDVGGSSYFTKIGEVGIRPVKDILLDHNTSPNLKPVDESNKLVSLGSETAMFKDAWVDVYKGTNLEIEDTVKSNRLEGASAVLSTNGVTLVNTHDRNKVAAYWRNLHGKSRLGILPSMLTRYNEEDSTEFKVYDEGNKPTPEEIGTYSKSESDSKFTKDYEKNAGQVSDIRSSGFYRLGDSVSTGASFITGSSQLIHAKGLNSNYNLQLISDSSSGNIGWRSFSDSSSGESIWNEFFHTGNKPTATDITGLLDFGEF